MKKTIILTTILTILLSGCTPPPPADTPDISDTPTPIETEENNPLLGSWILESQTIISPAGTIVHPFKGRTLTFLNNNTYTEDYSTEIVPDKTVNNPVQTVTTHCDVSGLVTGKYRINSQWNYDLEPPSSENTLEVIPTGGEKPKIECQTNTGGNPYGSTATTVALGHGPGNSDGYVEYTFNLNDSSTQLSIEQTNSGTGIKTIYIFTK